MGHLGYQQPSINLVTPFVLTEEDAKLLERLGCFALVLEKYLI
jgi:hypothetical protein